MILRHNANFQDLFFIFAELFMYRRTYALSLFQGAFLWLQTIDMDAFDNNVVESYKMSKSIFCCNRRTEKFSTNNSCDFLCLFSCLYLTLQK